MRIGLVTCIMLCLVLGTVRPPAHARPPAAPQSRNFVRNPGFEFVGPSGPLAWQVTKKDGFSISQAAHAGNSCIALASPKGEWPTIEQKVRLFPDRTYLLSFWLRKEGAGQLYVTLEGRDPRTETRWQFKHKLGASSEWQRKNLLVNPRGFDATLRFENYHRKGCTLFVDDVSLDLNLTSVVDLLEPSVEGESLANNTPTFRWQPTMDRKYLSFELLCSKSRTFPARATEVVSDLLEETEYTPFEPLANGVWFWKLHFAYNSLRENCTAEGETAVGIFRVRSDGKDYRAPRIESCGPTRIEDPGKAEISVHYADNPGGSGIDLSSVKFVIDDSDVTAKCKVSPTKLVFRPGTMIEAVHSAEITVADAAGNQTREKWWFLVKPKPKQGIVGWDPQKKLFELDGEPFFPFGMYQYRYDNSYKTYRDWGFNTVHFYDGTLPPGVQAASAAGLKVFALDVINRGVPEQASLFDHNVPFEDHPALPTLAQRIFKVCNEPSLFVWSIRDEPDKGPLSRKRLQQIDKFVKSLDPYHPTEVVLMKHEAYYAYAQSADFVVGDIYPYSMWTGKDKPEMIWNEPIHQDRAQGGDRPVLTILQHFGGRKGTSFPHLVPVGARRFMAYLAYIHGTRGMMWYAYGSSGYGEAPEYPEQWEDMKKLAAEIRDMTPVLLANDASENVLTRVLAPPNMKDRYDNPAIHYLMKQHEGKRYLITVNSAHKPVEAAFRIAAPVESIREIPSNREVEVVRGGSFADTYSPLGVHVYEIALRDTSARGQEPSGKADDPTDAEASSEELRTWTDATGKFHIEATLVEAAAGAVKLRRESGALISVPLKKLCDADREYVRNWGSRREP